MALSSYCPYYITESPRTHKITRLLNWYYFYVFIQFNVYIDKYNMNRETIVYMIWSQCLLKCTVKCLQAENWLIMISNNCVITQLDYCLSLFYQLPLCFFFWFFFHFFLRTATFSGIILLDILFSNTRIWNRPSTQLWPSSTGF